MIQFRQILGKSLSCLIMLFCASLMIAQENEDQENFRFLFLGHIYDWTSPAANTVDIRIEQLNKSQYDGIWLGGDVCANTTLDPKTLHYVDQLFKLKNPNTHFVLGNHDYRDNNLDFYFEATGRPDYYTHTFKNLVVSVINTNLNASDCQNLDAQYRMLEEVTDTLSTASHYVLLMHHQIFRDIPGLDQFKSNGVCDFYSMNCSSTNSLFSNTIYPRLIELERKGIEVIVVVGDTGWHKGSELQCTEGIDFLASGINNSYYKHKGQQIPENNFDHVLEFELSSKKRTLDWQFIKLNSLVEMR